MYFIYHILPGPFAQDTITLSSFQSIYVAETGQVLKAMQQPLQIIRVHGKRLTVQSGGGGGVATYRRSACHHIEK